MTRGDEPGAGESNRRPWRTPRADGGPFQSSHEDRTDPIPEDRTSAVLESVTEPVVEYVFDDGIAIVEGINDAFAETFGVTATNTCGRPLEWVFDDTDRPAELEFRNERFESEVTRRTSGGVRAFRLRITPIDGEKDRQIATYGQMALHEEYDKKLEALHEATRALIQQDSKSDVAEIAVETAVEVLDLPTAAVYIVDHDRTVLTPAASAGAIEAVVGDFPDLPIGDSLAGTVFMTGEVSRYDDPASQPGAYDPDIPIESELILPLGDHGVLLSGATEAEAFADIHVSLTTILASNMEAALDRIERAETLARREAQLEQKNERLEAFASMVSHDLRNPLNVARSYLDVAESREDLTYLARIDDAHDRMESLIEDLLQLARQGQERGSLVDVSLASVARDAWSQVRTEHAALEIEDTDVRLEADVSRLEACFENLYRNAIEHGRRDVTVRVGATDRGFFVADDGKGIPEGSREKAIEAGYSEDKHGTGMGLAIVTDVAQAHDWEVSIHESEDGGARFEFDVELDDQR